MIGQDKHLVVEPILIGRLQARQFPSRKEPDEEELRRLAASIKRYGLIHPILVRPAGRGYEVVCGQRRYLACKSLGMGAVPAVVRPLDDKLALELSIAENARREGLGEGERRSLLRRLEELFPGRKPEELESWLGSAPPRDESLPGWLDRLPETEANPVSVMVSSDSGGATGNDTKVMVAPPNLNSGRKSLLSRVKLLLNKLTKSGRLDADLLQSVVAELLRRLEKEPLYEFLDLSYRGRSKRYVTRNCLNVSKDRKSVVWERVCQYV